MYRRDFKNLICGFFLAAVGVSTVLYTYLNLNLGTLSRFGPGMFPLCIGIALSLLGLIIAVPAASRPGEKMQLRFWSPLFVLVSIVSFALVVPAFGLLPAVATVTALSASAELEWRPVETLMLCVAVGAISYVLFGLGLGLPVDMVRWAW